MYGGEWALFIITTVLASMGFLLFLAVVDRKLDNKKTKIYGVAIIILLLSAMLSVLNVGMLTQLKGDPHQDIENGNYSIVSLEGNNTDYIDAVLLVEENDGGFSEIPEYFRLPVDNLIGEIPDDSTGYLFSVWEEKGWNYYKKVYEIIKQ